MAGLETPPAEGYEVICLRDAHGSQSGTGHAH